MLRLATGGLAPILCFGALLMAQAPISIYIGPQTRDGFIDVDQGVLDSIKDVKNVFRKDKNFSVVEQETDATITLFIVGRYSNQRGGGVVVGPEGTSTYIPVKGRALDAILRVGTYERQFRAERPGPWSRLADALARDVRAWVKANRAKLAQ